MCDEFRNIGVASVENLGGRLTELRQRIAHFQERL